MARTARLRWLARKKGSLGLTCASTLPMSPFPGRNPFQSQYAGTVLRGGDKDKSDVGCEWAAGATAISVSRNASPGRFKKQRALCYAPIAR